MRRAGRCPTPAIAAPIRLCRCSLSPRKAIGEADGEKNLELDDQRRQSRRHAELDGEKEQAELRDADRHAVAGDVAPGHPRPTDEKYQRHRGEEKAQCRQRERRDFAQADLDRHERESPQGDDRKCEQQVAAGPGDSSGKIPAREKTRRSPQFYHAPALQRLAQRERDARRLGRIVQGQRRRRDRRAPHRRNARARCRNAASKRS